MIKSGNISINKTGPEENKEVYKLFINELKSNLRKEKYKKVLEDIEVGQKNFFMKATFHKPGAARLPCL